MGGGCRGTSARERREAELESGAGSGGGAEGAPHRSARSGGVNSWRSMCTCCPRGRSPRQRATKRCTAGQPADGGAPCSSPRMVILQLQRMPDVISGHLQRALQVWVRRIHLAPRSRSTACVANLGLAMPIPRGRSQRKKLQVQTGSCIGALRSGWGAGTGAKRRSGRGRMAKQQLNVCASQLLAKF